MKKSLQRTIIETTPHVVLFWIAFVVLFSCQPSPDQINETAKRKLFENSKNVNGYEISILEYDSCEYLISDNGYSQMMTHKGNCKYCKQRSK